MNPYPTFTFRISRQLADRLNRHADELGVSRGELMRQALIIYLDKM